MTRTVILVPRREGFAHRDKVWAWVKAWWVENLPDLPIIEGHHDLGLFNRSAALNEAAKGEWDTAVIIDADVIIDPDHVREAIKVAVDKGQMVVPFRVRHNLSQLGSEKVMRGEKGSWIRYVARSYHDQHSAVVVVPRTAWDTANGFDETFAGWGWEDTAFACTVTTLTGPLIYLDGEVWHLWHPAATEGYRNSPSAIANRSRGARYQKAMGNPDAIRALIAEQHTTEVVDHGIPRIFHRVVPEVTSPEVEAWWEALQALHPSWRFMTHRDPLDPAEWPETSRAWSLCRDGASLADLVRLEALSKWGGVYLDSDVQPFRSFEPLQPLDGFAAWEDEKVVPNAIMGFRKGHPAIHACLKLALREVRKSTWAAGPGVTTKVLVGRDDVLLLPPGSFYPVDYRDAARDTKMREPQPPWTFALHHYAGSWLAKEQSA